MKIKIDTIINDKNEFHRIITSSSPIDGETYTKRVATEIYSRKLTLKYHPDKFGKENFDNVPYVSQIWYLFSSSVDLLRDFRPNFLSYES